MLPQFSTSEVAIQGGQAGVNCFSVSCCFFSDIVAVSAESSQSTEFCIFVGRSWSPPCCFSGWPLNEKESRSYLLGVILLRIRTGSMLERLSLEMFLPLFFHHSQPFFFFFSHLSAKFYFIPTLGGLVYFTKIQEKQG